jgi:exopolysaccharide biosynthesis WecB/TagA/CpsF family protein
MSERILLVQLADIGDLVLTTPALAALRAARPAAHLALLTTRHSAPVLPAGLVDEIIPFDKHTFDRPRALLKPDNLREALGLAGRLRRGHYDTVVFFHHFTTRFGALKFASLAFSSGARRRVGLDNGNAPFLTDRIPDEGFGARHQAQYWLDLVGLLGADTTARPAQVAVAQGPGAVPAPLKAKAPGSIRIALHPGSGGYSLARRWEPTKFAAVADALAMEFNAQVVLLGTADDNVDDVRVAMRAKPVDMTGRTTLAQLAAVLKTCDLYIGADSGVMHIAAAVGIPVVAVFGPSNPDAWRPWTPGGRSAVVTSDAACSPCSYVGHSIGLRDGCAARSCMQMISAGRVVKAARALLTATPVLVGGEGPDDRNSSIHYTLEMDAFDPSRPIHNALGFGAERGPSAPRRIEILGVPVDAITYEAWLSLIERWVLDRGNARAHHVCTVNPEFIMIARSDPNFYNVLTRADLCIPDGVGLLWAARYKGEALPERVTGSDGVPRIAERAAQEGWRLFFLGAAPGIADRAAEILMERYPGLKVVGTYSGSPAPYEEDELAEQINASGADILFVAYGAPVQDKWIARNLPRLHVKMAMGVGGTFDFIAGIIPRAPQWMQRLGIEWLYRLYLQPWRIKRMMRLPRFVLAVLREGRGAPSA